MAKQTNSRSNTAREKAAAMRRAQQMKERRRAIAIWSAVAAVVALIIVGVAISIPSSPRTQPTAASVTGPEGIALEQGTVLASASTAASGETVGGIQCNSMEQSVFHIHAHLAIYIDGALRPVPGGIGVVTPIDQPSAAGDFYGASKCYYWLHTHAQDGIIHIESPIHTTFTLGQFFAIWRQSLSTDQVGATHGALVAYVNGQRYTGDPASIPLTAHADIQLDVGTSTPGPQPVDWSHAQL